jgi:uncharacterized protein YrrD
MERKILFQKNADVLTASGKQLGSLERVVLNPETNVITDIVIQGGTLFNKENRVVPIDLVAETTENQVRLHGEPGELKSFPPFEEMHIVEENDINRLDTSVDAPQVIYGVSGMGIRTVIMPETEEQFATTIEQNIPPGTVALREGAKVITADEKHVGNVERVLADPSVDQVTHLLMTQGLLMKEQKLIPITWVTTLGEDTVHLRVKEDVIAALESTTD